jgi:hypothetical protein
MKVLAILSLILALSGCATEYSLLYKTKVTPSPSVASSKAFTFNLAPLPNGIVFSVVNNTNQTAKIIWDKSYFIMPDGNSYKALNTDILREQKEVVDKAQYISSIPSKSTFTRFTTATLNASKITQENVSVFVAKWNGYDTTHVSSVRQEFLHYGAYWPVSTKADVAMATNDKKTGSIKKLTSMEEAKVLKALKPIGNTIQKGNKLGIGLVIEHEGVENEYRFDVVVEQIDAVKTTKIQQEVTPTIEKHWLDFTYDVATDNWQKVEIEYKKSKSNTNSK